MHSVEISGPLTWRRLGNVSCHRPQVSIGRCEGLGELGGCAAEEGWAPRAAVVDEEAHDVERRGGGIQFEQGEELPGVVAADDGDRAAR